MAKARIAIVVSEFNEELTKAMLESALKHAETLGLEVVYVCKVPGAYDIPLSVQWLLSKEEIDAVATLGAIVKGETLHDETIGQSLFCQLSTLSLRFNKPVTLGVCGPGLSWQQGLSRREEYARRAIDAVAKMVKCQRIVGEIKPMGNTVIVE